MSHVILVTGAGTGMGALASLSLAAAGHTVYATMRDPEGRNLARAEQLREQAKDATGVILVAELDILSEESAARAVRRVVEEQDRIEVVVHNAAHLYLGLTEAFTPEQLLKAYDTNTVGAMRVTRAVLPVMRRQASGLLLWNGSGTTRAIPPFLGAYSAAKAAFDALAESVAWDVASLGIDTNILQPGVFVEGTHHFAGAAFAADAAVTSAYDATVTAARLASSGEDTRRLISPDGADPRIVAEEIVRIVALEPGTRPRRSIADASDYGAEIVNGAAEQLRLRLARRMGITDLLGSQDQPVT